MSEVALAELRSRVARLEDEGEVRRVIARYFQICDNLGPDTPFEELRLLFTTDARWEGKGRYQQAFGGYEGRSAIVDMIASYCQPIPHFLMTAHFFSAEHLRIDGDAAHGDWMMLQTSTYHDGRSDLRSAKLDVRFARDAGTWRIAHFKTLNLFSRAVNHWSDDQRIPVPEAVNGDRS